MDSVSSLIPKILKARGLHGHAQASMLVMKAQEWIEEKLPDIRDQLKVHTFKDGEIIIHCENSIAAQECHGMGSNLLEHLRKEVPDVVVEGVRLVRDGEMS